MRRDREVWEPRAACKEYDPDTWFPEKGDCATSNQAKKICNQFCEVRDECREWVTTWETAYGPLEGVWGGLTHEQRKKKRAKGETKYECIVCHAMFVRQPRGAILYCSDECQKEGARLKKRRRRADKRENGEKVA